MSGGAFRDAGTAAIERVSILEQEKADLEAEVARLRGEAGERRDDDVKPNEVARLKVQLAAERADLKEALTELNPLARKLEAAEKAFHAAKDDARLAAEETRTAKGRLAIAHGELATARDTIHELRVALRSAEDGATLHGQVTTEVPPNLEAYMQRIQGERDDLREEVRILKEAAASTAGKRRSFLGALFGRRS